MKESLLYPNKPAVDHSIEAQCRLPTLWQKKPKRDLIKVTKTCETLLDLANLPADAKFDPLSNLRQCVNRFRLAGTASVDLRHFNRPL